MIAHLNFIRRLVILLLLTLAVSLSNGQEKAKQAKVGWLLADKITFTPGNQAAGLYVRSDASGNLSLADAVKDSFAIEDLFYVKQTTGVPDSLKLLNAPKNKFWAGPVSGGGSGRPGYRAIELADLPPGIGGSPSWGLTGNAGTNPDSNYLGTSDAAHLLLKSNNTEVVRITPDSAVLSKNIVVNPEGPAGLQSSRQLVFNGRSLDNQYQVGYIRLRADGNGLYGGALNFMSASGSFVFGTNPSSINYTLFEGDASLRGGNSLTLFTTNTSKGIVLENQYRQTIGNLLEVKNTNIYGKRKPHLIVTAAGNVGIGDSLTTADATLHVAGSFKYVDGNQAAGKVLICNAAGVGSWQTFLGGLDSVMLQNTGVLHAAPTYVRTGSKWTISQSLATQSAYRLLGTGDLSGTPSFRTIDSNYFGGSFASQVRAASWNNPVFTGSVSTSAGTAASPSINFSDANTGLYRHTSMGVGISISGVGRWGFSSTIFGSLSSRGAQLSQTAGNAGAPQYNFVLNTTAGLYQSSANEIGLSTNGLAALHIDASQRVGIGTATPVSSAALDISSTTRAFYPPRMTTTQRDAMAGIVAGATVYCTDCTANDASTGVLQTYNGSSWKNNW